MNRQQIETILNEVTIELVFIVPCNAYFDPDNICYIVTPRPTLEFDYTTSQLHH